MLGFDQDEELSERDNVHVEDLQAQLGRLNGKGLVCQHPSHNEPEGCGNPECWKYQKGAFTKLGDPVSWSREDWEQLTLKAVILEEDLHRTWRVFPEECGTGS